MVFLCDERQQTGSVGLARPALVTLKRHGVMGEEREARPQLLALPL